MIIKESAANDSSLRSFLCWENAPVSSSPEQKRDEIMNSAVKKEQCIELVQRAEKVWNH
jgi:hypothetical protein